MNNLIKKSYHHLKKRLRFFIDKESNEKSEIKDLEMSIPQWTRREEEGKDRALVRIGFIGAGKYAQNHLKVLSNFDQVEIFSICTKGSPRVNEIASKYNIPNIFNDLDEFLSQKEIDAFVVVVPIIETKFVVWKCLSTGKPVLLEKPASLSSSEIEELVKQADKYQTFGMVAMNRRFYSIVEHGLAALADCGPLRGAILEVPENISERRKLSTMNEEVYDHWMMSNSIHGIDLLKYILGNIVTIQSFAKANHKYKNAGASFATICQGDNGVVGTILALWDTIPKWRLKVIAEKGWLEFEPLEKGWFVNQKGNKIQITPDLIDIEYRPGVYAQDLHFIKAVRAGKKPSIPACLLPDAYETSLLIEKIISDSEN